MEEERKDRIDRLNSTLYSRTQYKNPLDKRTPVKEGEDGPNVETKWQSPELDEMLKHEHMQNPPHPLLKKIFISALLFFIAAIGVAAFVFMGGVNFVSSKNVDINVLGPTIISAGEVLELGVSVSNTNNADLEFTNLSIQYPQGSRAPGNNAEPLTYTKDDLGVIKAGSEFATNVSMILLGSAGETKEIKFSLEYKVKGSNATFYKDKIFEVMIGEAPMTLEVESPSSVTSGNTFSTTISVTLNSTEVLKNVALKADYPYGYIMTSSTPQPVSEDNVWLLGDLSPGTKKTITLNGQLVGENREERTFRFYVGVSDSINVNPTPKIIITSLLNTVAINRQSVDLNVAFNGESSTTYIAPASRSISTSIKFTNNLPEKLLSPRLEVTLSGQALDKLSVLVGNNGVYDPVNSKITWNLSNLLSLPELIPGESGQVSFNFSSLGSQLLSDGSNIVLNLSLIGTPASAVGQQPLVVSDTRTVKISSQVNLSSKSLRSLGSFVNYGPIPPKVGEESTYTIIFDVGNTRGDLSNAVLTARLGPNVSWLSAKSFVSEDITYDASQNVFTWNLGTLTSGTGFSSNNRQVSFQISLTPSTVQIGTAPVLVSNISLSGDDNVTGEKVTANNPPLTTRLVNDPAFIQGDDIVVK